MDPENAAAVPQQTPSPVPSTDPAVQRELEGLKAQNQYLANTVQGVVGWAQSQEQARIQYERQAEEARIAALPPQDQAIEHAKLARRENEALRQYIAQQAQQYQRTPQQPPGTTAPQVDDRQRELTPAQIATLQAQLCTRANEFYGLTGEQALTVADVPANFQKSQELFQEKLVELGTARKRAGTPSEDDMAKKSTPAANAPAGRPATATSAANRPMSPQATAPARAVDRGDFQTVLSETRPGTSVPITPGQRAVKLAQLREEAAAKLQR
jgi:hypothetical protein